MKSFIIIIIVILSVGIIVLTVLNVILSQTRIDPKKYPSVKGSFGLNVNSKIVDLNGSLSQINKCGVNKSSPCVSSVNSLSEAVDYCNFNADICDTFLYSNGNVIIVDSTGIIVDDNSYDRYSRQYPTIIN